MAHAQTQASAQRKSAAVKRTPDAIALLMNDHKIVEADVEHAGAKDLIAQLEAMKPGDDHYDAKVTVLGECIDHRVGAAPAVVAAHQRQYTRAALTSQQSDM